MASKTESNLPTAGILEWFRPGEYKRVEQTIEDLKALGVDHLRTGVSWADWHVEGAEEWFDWFFKTLSQHVEILPCFLYTPPSLGIVPKTSAPPKYLKSYADFIDIMISRYGDYFEWVELWNEPNNRLEYDYTLDYSWNKFATMIIMAAYWAKQCGKKTLLGGMSPIDPNWLHMMFDKNAMENIDAIGIHGFPDVFDQQWSGWESNIKNIREVLQQNKADHIEIWISEAGFSTWQHDEIKQYEEFKKLLNTGVSRVYWYSLYDLDPKHSTVGGFHLDEREYSFGLKKADGSEKLLYKLLAKGGVENIHRHHYAQKTYKREDNEPYILITGGCGFIGTNLSKHFLKEGRKVMVYDNLSRPGVEYNLQWLKKRYPDQLIIQVADIKEEKILEECIKHAEVIFHFSAQVAVTSSLENPNHDFEVNMKGTFNLLEAVRKSAHRPPVFFTSTNKVYGTLSSVKLKSSKDRYIPIDEHYRKFGVDESQYLEFHSPYGCSKGAADQYILDYARSFGLRSAVFRMSCIYGPHQFGTEDQGWVAHFMISALQGKPITIYGNGKQVRDILFVEDLVDAFVLAWKNIEKVSGHVFNIGGGPGNTISLLELLNVISADPEIGEQDVRFEKKRIGDQYYYVSDIRKFGEMTGWKPRYDVRNGTGKLLEWLKNHGPRPLAGTSGENPNNFKSTLV